MKGPKMASLPHCAPPTDFQSIHEYLLCSGPIFEHLVMIALFLPMSLLYLPIQKVPQIYLLNLKKVMTSSCSDPLLPPTVIKHHPFTTPSPHSKG